MDRQTIVEQIVDRELQVQFNSYLDRSENIDFTTFVEEVDQSDYSVTDWADALVGFDHWLSSDKPRFNTRDFTHMVGYLHCCQMTISANLSKPKMRDVVNQCLNDFGYDPTQPSQ